MIRGLTPTISREYEFVQEKQMSHMMQLFWQDHPSSRNGEGEVVKTVMRMTLSTCFLLVPQTSGYKGGTSCSGSD